MGTRSNPAVGKPKNDPGLPQLATRATPIRSPCWTGTAGDIAKVLSAPTELKGPRSAVIVSVFPLRRKNLILIAFEHPACDQ